MEISRLRATLLSCAAAVCLLLLVTGCDIAAPGADPGQSAPAASDTPRSGLPEVAAAELPPEARELLDVIAQGGPYDYPQDDQVFGNRERRLPDREHGYYREYTAPTPGEEDRGARRLVVGEGGDVYYTADHYRTFRQVRLPARRAAA